MRATKSEYFGIRFGVILHLQVKGIFRTGRARKGKKIGIYVQPQCLKSQSLLGVVIYVCHREEEKKLRKRERGEMQLFHVVTAHWFALFGKELPIPLWQKDEP